jgi:branched-chain amino acid transport system permease protein
MRLTLPKVLLYAFWFTLLAFPIVGIRMTDYPQNGIEFRLTPLIIGGVVLFIGALYLGLSKVKLTFISDALGAAFAPVKPMVNTLAKPSSIKIEIILFCLFLLILPAMLTGKYMNLAIDTGIYIILALGLNVVVGLAGLLVLGYAGFWAIGAYAYALASLDFNCPFWLGLVIGGGVAAIFGLLVGLPSLRLRGDYLAIVTLGFGELIRYLLKNLPAYTGGEKGLPNELIRGEIHHPTIGPWILSQPIYYYYLTLIFVVITVIMLERLNNSRMGRALIAVREDELAATTMGINATKMKIMAFVISAAWAGLAGVLYAAKINYVSPESFRFDQSALILAMVILGGMGSTFGVILGAIILYIIPWFIRDQFPAFQDYRLLIYGATMVLMMLFRPQGLISSKRRKVELVAEE